MTSDLLKMIFGILLLLVVAGVLLAIIFGHVNEKVAESLTDGILISLTGLVSHFGSWAFGGDKKNSTTPTGSDTKIT